MNYAEESLRLHEQWRGKLETVPKMAVDTRESLSLAYTPGVAQPCIEIQKDPAKSYTLTGRWNTVAVVTDGTAVLGLGDIGPEAAMPVMEGKCVLFKAFGGVDAVPICLRTKAVDEIVRTVELLAGSFGGINLEDISAPRCFEIERRLKQVCDIPVFHDDQHGTAVVTLAALLNALRLTDRTIDSARIVINGAGSAGVSIARLLLGYARMDEASSRVPDIVLCDRQGIVYESVNTPDGKGLETARMTPAEDVPGTLADAMRGADVFIGVSAPGTVTPDMVRSMNKDPILFPMANPVPEIDPSEALAAGAAVVGTGRSDYANQINNVLAFPGIFRGAFDVRAGDINQAMELAAAKALSGLVTDRELRPDYIIPTPFDPRVRDAVASAVARAAQDSGAARGF